MSKALEMCDAVLKLDKEAISGPWEYDQTDGTYRYGKTAIKHYSDDSDSGASINADLITHYRSSCPRLAKALKLALDALGSMARSQQPHACATNNAVWYSEATLAKIEAIMGDET